MNPVDVAFMSDPRSVISKRDGAHCTLVVLSLKAVNEIMSS
jgi:hypothetical protein